MNISNPMRADEGHLPQEEITIAEALKTKGYSTGHFGKWHVGGFDAETAGSHVMPPWMAGFDECFSTHNVIVTHDPYAKLGKGGIKACYWHNGRNIPLYFSNITAVDTQVGALRSELRKLGVADNTMLWFTSDNGPNLKGKQDVKRASAQDGKFTYTPLGSTGAFRGWKRDCYEGGLRLPGILEWPAKIKQPFSTDFAAVASDYFPTALDAAEIPLPTDREYDGISLLPLIERHVTERESAIGVHCSGMQAWTGNRYKIVRTIKSKRKASAQWELYDLLADPFEENDLAPTHPQIVQRMARDFAKWAESAQADQQKVIAKYSHSKSKPVRKTQQQHSKLMR
jgi:arylsulfatase A-like enzyme